MNPPSIAITIWTLNQQHTCEGFDRDMVCLYAMVMQYTIAVIASEVWPKVGVENPFSDPIPPTQLPHTPTPAIPANSRRMIFIINGPVIVLLICRTRPMSNGSKEKPDVRRSPCVVSKRQKRRSVILSYLFLPDPIYIISIGVLRLLTLFLSVSTCYRICVRFFRPWNSMVVVVVYNRRSRGHRNRYPRLNREAGCLGPDGYRERADRVTAIIPGRTGHEYDSLPKPNRT